MSFYIKTINGLQICKHLIRRNFATEQKEVLMKLKDKVVLITGGTGSIGRAITNQLICARAKQIFLVDLCASEDLQCEYDQCFGEERVNLMECDVKEASDMEDCFKEAVTTGERLDIFINAAGIFNGREWEEEIQTNLFATIRNNIIAQKFLSKHGVILNLCGIQGLDPLIPSPTLSAEFSGVVAMSRTFGHPVNFQRSLIRTLTLCTGITKTKFTYGAATRQINTEMGELLENHLKTCVKQEDDHCAKAAMHVLCYGQSGTTWAIDGGTLYSVNFPVWQDHSKLEYQYY